MGEKVEPVGCSAFLAEHQSFTLILRGRLHVIPPPPPLFPPHFATVRVVILTILLFTHFSLTPLNPSPPHPDELKRTQPLSPSQQLGVADFKARDVNNQAVIFSVSSSCY